MSNIKDWRRLCTLLKLAELGAHRRAAKISTEFLARKLGISQQSASRRLIELEHIGWINRTITREGCLVRITDHGLTQLKRLYSNLQFIMEKSYPPSVTFEGVVFTGFGEGAYYVSRDHYRKQFIEKLGFDPYPGTLNLKLVTEYDIKTYSELGAYPAIEIDGFVDEDRTFGPVKCYPATIENKFKGAVISAMRSHYNSSVVELISPVCLRKALDLKDGNKVKVEVLTLP